MPEINPKNRGR